MLVGGQGSIPGVLLGTALMFVVPQVFRGFAEYRYFVFGIAMIVIMVLLDVMAGFIVTILTARRDLDIGGDVNI